MDEPTCSSPSSAADRDDTPRQPQLPRTLSSSEPSLRFPRPQGDRRLANWVSSSQPDIMSADPDGHGAHQPEESGLSDSTYEVINNTDTESADDFPAGSVCSSDYMHGDDVHSLVGTEYTGDDNDIGDHSDASEGVVLPGQVHDGSRSDVSESVVLRNQAHDDGGNHSDASEGVVLPSGVQDVAAEESDDDAEDTGSDSEEEQIIENPANTRPQKSWELKDTTPTTATSSEKSPEDEESRTSALQYAEESLETPSASIHADVEEQERKRALLAEFHDVINRSMASAYTVASAVGLVFAVGFACFLIQCCLAPPGQPDSIIPAQPEVQTTISVSTSTIVINYTSTKTVLISETRTAAPPATATDTLLLPSSPAQRAPEKSEGKGICSAEVHSPREILVRMPHNTKLYWLAKDSISIEVARGEEPIKAKFSSVDEGILIEIAKAEARGVVDVSVTTTRRPKVNETFAVDFGRGFADVAMDFGRLVAQDVADMFAVASVESARRAEEMQGAAAGALRRVEESLNTARAGAWKVWDTTRVPAPGSLFSGTRDRASRIAEVWAGRARELEEETRLGLLKAQVRAKAAWLGISRDGEAREEFLGKAARYLRERVAEAEWRRVERHVEARNARRGRGDHGGFRTGYRRGCLPWGRSCLE